jgi:3-oxoadipate enol-lactonase
MPFAIVNKQKLNYRLDGPLDKPVIVLLNSIATDLSVWDAVADDLSTSFRVLRFDARGQGQSSIPEGAYSLALLGQDLIGLLDELKLESVNLCGLSLGAMVTMWIALHYPDRLEKLILCNTAAYVGPPESWDMRATAVREKGMVAIRPAILERWLSASFVANNAIATERILRMSLGSPPDGYIGSCAAIRDMDLRNEIRSINAPTLVISGAEDTATTPADAQYIAENIPSALHKKLPGGHLSNVEQPSQIVTEIRTFLAV